MQGWRHRLETVGPVTLFDYPYMREKKRRPDPQPKLIEAHREAIRAISSESPLVLTGKSMGSRIGCHVAAAPDEIGARVRALVCFGYPLRGQSGKLRDQVLLELRAPILFVQGTRDALCPLDLLEKTRTQMAAKNQVYVVEGGDHSLAVSKGVLAKRSEHQSDVDRRILDAIVAFLNDVLSGG
jgi:predicted alpha/beta-hydrolase family hydrolase